MSRLDEIYTQVPGIDCQGLCHESCGPLVLTDAERQRIVDRHSVTIPDLAWGTCPALTMLRRCAVHEDRPLLCRLWARLKAARYACQVCNARNTMLNVHHRTYERRGEEYAQDLIVLCESCHHMFHRNGSVAPHSDGA